MKLASVFRAIWVVTIELIALVGLFYVFNLITEREHSDDVPAATSSRQPENGPSRL